MLDQNEFEIDKYYKLTNLVEEGRDLRGKFVKNTYTLTPKTFKKCLIRSLKQQKYADYYLFLEEALSYYSEFQKLKLKQQHKVQLMDAKEKSIMTLVDQFKHDQ